MVSSSNKSDSLFEAPLLLLLLLLLLVSVQSSSRNQRIHNSISFVFVLVLTRCCVAQPMNQNEEKALRLHVSRKSKVVYNTKTEITHTALIHVGMC